MNTGSDKDELREFLMVLRDSLLMIVRYIERRYRIGPPHERQ